MTVTIWLAVLTTAVVLTFAALVAHHLWEERRDAAALDRHDVLIKAIEDQRKLTLAAISDRSALASRVTKLETWKDRETTNSAARAAGA